MLIETMALTGRALRKWVRNPAAVLPGFFVALFYVLLLGSSFNPAKLVPPGAPPQVAATILASAFSGAPTDNLDISEPYSQHQYREQRSIYQASLKTLRKSCSSQS